MASLNLRRFTDPDVLRQIDQRRLIAFLSPWRDYLHRRGVTLRTNGRGLNLDRLTEVLLQPEPDVPKEMVDALYYVNETAGRDEIDALLEMAKRRSVAIGHDLLTTVADVAIQIWLTAPDVLREHHAETAAFRQKNFLYYGSKARASRELPPLNVGLARQIEAELDIWFEAHRRGRNAHVSFFLEITRSGY